MTQRFALAKSIYWSKSDVKQHSQLLANLLTSGLILYLLGIIQGKQQHGSYIFASIYQVISQIALVPLIRRIIAYVLNVFSIFQVISQLILVLLRVPSVQPAITVMLHLRQSVVQGRTAQQEPPHVRTVLLDQNARQLQNPSPQNAPQAPINHLLHRMPVSHVMETTYVQTMP